MLLYNETETVESDAKQIKYTVIFLQFCLYGSWDSLGPEFMHPKLKLCIQPGTRGEIQGSKLIVASSKFAA